ncbi:MAG TPA: DNA-directed RNA polymerase subunit beta, partial [Candidatus Yonathbacteria bacterium]|nr:DNA-directed RNA polymerase subunit beta [Candidatus Yonathbacteria bacterium]
MLKEKKYFSRYKEPLTELPNLVEVQLDSYKWLVEEGVEAVFKEFSPIKDYSEKKFELLFTKFELAGPKYNEHYAKENKLTYEAPLRVHAKLINKTTGSEKEQEIFMADFPMMTPHGTFIINGVERVFVPQLARSFGIFFTAQEIKGKRYFGAKIVPARGAWVEIESDADGALYVRIDKKRKFPATSLLRVFGFDTDKKIKKVFKGDPAEASIEATLEKDPAKTVEEAYIEIYRRLRDGDMATAENAKEFINGIFSEERYDLHEVGRYKFNKRFGLGLKPKDLESRAVSGEDLKLILSNIASLNADSNSSPDDIDHLGSRRVRPIGEMMQQKVRFGMSQMRRNIQDRMSTIDSDASLPIQFISPRPLQARIKEFFTTNQLSQYMMQYNILAEIQHLRQLSALGPGGLTRERAGLDVRDVHSSHYGRACPIATPEGPNIGLILSLAIHARINNFGIIETPYAKVEKGKVTSKIVYLDAFEDEKYRIAHAAVAYDASGKILGDKIETRKAGKPGLFSPSEVDYIDVAPSQAFSVGANMIPFLEHDDANRALMGSNMQKQGTPCIVPEAPIVATGMEESAAVASGRIVTAEEAGTIEEVDARHIVLNGKSGKKHEYKLVNYARTNGFTTFHQRPYISLGDKVKKGDILADTSSSDGGQIALGQNVRVAFMAWGGANFEDAIILSEKLVRNKKFSTI